MTASFHSGVGYLRKGLGLVRATPGLYVQIAVLFSLPALLAAALVLALTPPLSPGWSLLIDALDAVTVAAAPVVVMMAVAAGYRREGVSLGPAVWRALPWLPRYLWTNAHSSLIFWGPVGLLLLLRRWQGAWWPGAEAVGVVVAIGWWLLIGGLALYLHTRTLLAPYLAIHSNLPATRATLESWRLSGAHLGPVIATLLTGSLPMVLPLLGLGILILNLGGANRALMHDLELVFSHLVWVGLQIVRPMLIPAVYFLYRELWDAELVQRTLERAPETPPAARLLLSLTEWFPPLGPVGRQREPAGAQPVEGRLR